MEVQKDCTALQKLVIIDQAAFVPYFSTTRGGSRARVQGVRTPPPPRNDLRFSNTTGIPQKKRLCGLLVLK